MIYFCNRRNRRSLILQHPVLNGIDYLEVASESSECGCGNILRLNFLKPAAGLTITTSNISIEGGSSALAHVAVQSVTQPAPDTPNVVIVILSGSGDFSTYTLSLIAMPGVTDPPSRIDPQLASVSFSFKAGCAVPGDCLTDTCCPPTALTPPDINYLARDYDSVLRAMLDRMAVLTPAWSESFVPDAGVALLETLAYAADHAAYAQDAVGTEAYLNTSRSRISLRRHARLVDYTVDDGANARAWIYVRCLKDAVPLPQFTQLHSQTPGLPAIIPLNAPQATLQALDAAGPTFLTMQQATLYLNQNLIPIYTWSDTGCCLAPRATSLTLYGNTTSLTVGSVLLLEEVLGPETGNSEDANPEHRWFVRLTSVRDKDYLGSPLIDPLTLDPITEIAWDMADALPFPLCISSTTDSDHGSRQLTQVSVARGNIVPADQGKKILGEPLPVVPDAPPAPIAENSCSCQTDAPVDAPQPRYRPQLAVAPLTFASAFDSTAPASQFTQPSQAALPRITLTDSSNDLWTPEQDLFASTTGQMNFVAEIEADGTTFLRFGDGQYGAAVDPGQSFTASYRAGNGSSGNVGRDTLLHAIGQPLEIAEVRNPLAASGGRDGETVQHIRQTAPFAFQSQLRCVTTDDYQQQTRSMAGVEDARATFRWTGSWYTAFVSVEAANSSEPAPALVSAIEDRLNTQRMAGTDLEVEGAVLVGLDIALEICVDPAHFQDDVRDAILALFLAGDPCRGVAGLLSAKNFTFGETVYLSPLVAAAQGVEGVLSVSPVRFRRMDGSGNDDPLTDGVALGYLTMGHLEIPYCDSNPNRLDLGHFTLIMDGGK